MKVVIGEFMQESNAFSPVHATIRDFALSGIFRGEEILRNNENKPTAVGGMISALREAGAEMVFSISMRAQSGGIVEHEVLEDFLRELLQTIREQLLVDGVFLSFHGATQTTETGDGVGYAVSRVRSLVGEQTVIAASYDLHANLTEQIIRGSDIACSYQTYPHVDHFETGRRAASLGIRCILEREKGPKMASCTVPMIVPASVYTTETGIFGELVREARGLRDRGEILDFSICPMQPWLDVENGGSTATVISEDLSAAKRYAQYFANRLYGLRKELKPALHSIDEIAEAAAQAPFGSPVVLTDSADSSNAGATGDGAFVLEKLLPLKDRLKAALVINDAPAVRLAMETGVGKEAEFTLGGSIDSRFKRLRVRALVHSLHEGDFTREGPASRGVKVDCGPTAVLRIGKIDVVVTSYMTANGDPQLFRGFGIEPTFYQLVAVKACTSFRAAYSRFASEIVEADTPGAASVDLKSLPFRFLPKGFYPFEDREWSAPEAIRGHILQG